MSDGSAGRNSKRPAVSRFSQRRMPAGVDMFPLECV
jgi:hypothetical protein